MRIHNSKANLDVNIPAGKPVLVQWQAKNRQRSGVSTAVGWLQPGEKPGSIQLVHSCFATHDQIEQEHTASWTVWMSSIRYIRVLQSVRW